MTMPHRIWRLSIVVAYLYLVRITYSATINVNDNKSTAASYTEYASRGNHDNLPYEVIDVAQHNGNAANIRTGETMRIFTTGEVDEEFWYKHLGEDFRNAVHLQVGGGQPYANTFNRKNQTNEQYEYANVGENLGTLEEEPTAAEAKATEATAADSSVTATHDSPVEENVQKSDEQQEVKQNATSATSYEEPKNVGSDKNATMGEIVETNVEDKKEMEIKKIEDEEEHTEPGPTKDGDDGESATSAYQKQNVIKIAENNENSYTNEQHDTNEHNKYTHKPTPNQKNTKKYTEIFKLYDKATGIFGSPYAPIVVNLPDNHKTVHHTEEEEKAVVVRMPPIIYHGIPSYTDEAVEDSKETQNQPASQTHTYTSNSKHYSPTQTTNTEHKNTYTQQRNYQQNQQDEKPYRQKSENYYRANTPTAHSRFVAENLPTYSSIQDDIHYVVSKASKSPKSNRK